MTCTHLRYIIYFFMGFSITEGTYRYCSSVKLTNIVSGRTSILLKDRDLKKMIGFFSASLLIDHVPFSILQLWKFVQGFSFFPFQLVREFSRSEFVSIGFLIFNYLPSFLLCSHFSTFVFYLAESFYKELFIVLTSVVASHVLFCFVTTFHC